MPMRPLALARNDIGQGLVVFTLTEGLFELSGCGGDTELPAVMQLPQLTAVVKFRKSAMVMRSGQMNPRSSKYPLASVAPS